jgi:hypothetical protein
MLRHFLHDYWIPCNNAENFWLAGSILFPEVFTGAEPRKLHKNAIRLSHWIDIFFTSASFCAAETLFSKAIISGWPIAASIRATTVSKDSVLIKLTRWT